MKHCGNRRSDLEHSQLGLVISNETTRAKQTAIIAIPSITLERFTH